MVVLTEEEKKEMSAVIAKELPKLRQLLNVTQAELGYLCGFSRIRVSQIETGKAEMSWSQLTSVMFVVMANQRAKEYFCANNLLGARFLQFIQRKDENIPPDVNVTVRPDFIAMYQEIAKKVTPTAGFSF